MDFVEGLPRVNDKSMILTVVDQFSKLAHFILLAHLYTAMTVARAFFDSIVRLHGIPSSIVTRFSPASSRQSSSPASNLTCHRRFTHNPTASQRLSTRSSSCICATSSAIGRGNGCSGSPGQSTVTTPPSRPPFTPCHSAWS
jgi:hypothetical protein